MGQRPRTPVRGGPGPRPREEPEGDEASLGFERLVFFSDAVFAIVITLLVLPLTAEIDLPEGDGGLARHVLALWPSVLTFVVSFLVVGQFWIAHHRTFGHLHRNDHTLMWLNLVVLLTVAFMPFPAALLGARSTAEDAFPVVFYAASMTATSAAITATWLYALRRGLTRPSLSRAEARRITLRAFTTTAVMAISIAAAFLGLTVAVVFWLGVLPAARLLVSRRS
jgi:uncharacterized membrane protein